MTLRSKAVKLIVKAITAALFFLTTIIGVTFINRSTLPYNAEGRYFDPETNIVYHQQSIGVYGFVTVVLLVSTVISGYAAFKSRRGSAVNR
jgi:hypothetical protein